MTQGALMRPIILGTWILVDLSSVSFSMFLLRNYCCSNRRWLVFVIVVHNRAYDK